MSLLVVGLSHRGAPVSLLEGASISGDDVPKALAELIRGPHVSEALVLSTCNRVEIYADVDRFHGGVHDLTALLARNAGADIPTLGKYLYVHYEDAAVEHLFAVAAGLDSMVVGESQILGQLKLAYRVADTEGAAGRTLHELCQKALHTGKRVRTDTGIDRLGSSLVSVALGQAAVPLGGLPGRRALVVGAGSMGALAAATLRRARVGALAVVNRTRVNAARLVAALSGTAGDLDGLPAELARADLVVTTTGASGLVVPYGMVERILPDRDGRPLVIVDLALPRDVDPAVAELPGVTYIGLDALGEVLAGTGVSGDVAAARRIVGEEVAAYLRTQRSMDVAPTVAALRARAAEVVDAELVRLDGRLPGLPGNVHDEVGRAIRRVVDKLLHVPTVRVKELADEPGGGAYAEALRELFGLDPAATAAVTTPSASRPSASPSDGPPLRPAGVVDQLDSSRGGVFPTSVGVIQHQMNSVRDSAATDAASPAAAGVLRLGTRGSTLARVQSGSVAAAVTDRLGRQVELVEISTDGDRSRAPLTQIGGTGVFVSALREALLAGRIDLAVHSYKDLPTAPEPGLVVAAVPTREDPRDVLVARAGATLAQLPTGARLGTGAPRRVAQLRALGLGLDLVPVRGNVDTRLAKVTAGELDGLVLARAGLARLGRLDVVTETLDPIQVLPAPAQGALAVECRAADTELVGLLAGLDDPDTRTAVEAERALLAALEAGCTAPVGALAELVEGEAGLELFLRASVTAIDGAHAVRLSATGPVHDAGGVGRRLAADLLADGAAELMGSTR
ncbi:MAG TPA: glutamyl-tRNA reductase [Mycobacteriales bacterium]|nr:glutamyl-tRNA reductase [Mycobacteriales bacterium]